MSDVAEVAYVRIGTANVAAQADFARDIIGLRPVDSGGEEAWFRSDIRRRTLVFFPGEASHSSVGIAYRSPEDLDAAVRRLEAAGHAPEAADRETCEQLFVRRAFRLCDPSGNRIDLVHGPHHSGRRFFPTRDNGVLGMEGVSLRSAVADADVHFWSDALGFSVRDWAGSVCYIGMDSRHHRIALYPSAARGPLCVHFEVEDLEQIMINNYFMQDRQVRIAFGPGREAASGRVFLQMSGPDGLLYGFGAQMRTVDPAHHRPRQFRAEDSLCCWGARPRDVPEYAAAARE